MSNQNNKANNNKIKTVPNTKKQRQTNNVKKHVKPKQYGQKQKIKTVPIRHCLE